MPAASSRLGAPSLRRMWETWTPAVLTLMTSVATSSTTSPTPPPTTCPVATLSWYEGVGHTAHLEQPDRFNHELATLTRHASARVQAWLPASGMGGTR
jgi:pimeloyl-ACP methyl ester carboxylesterase